MIVAPPVFDRMRVLLVDVFTPVECVPFGVGSRYSHWLNVYWRGGGAWCGHSVTPACSLAYSIVCEIYHRTLAGEANGCLAGMPRPPRGHSPPLTEEPSRLSIAPAPAPNAPWLRLSPARRGGSRAFEHLVGSVFCPHFARRGFHRGHNLHNHHRCHNPVTCNDAKPQAGLPPVALQGEALVNSVGLLN